MKTLREIQETVDLVLAQYLPKEGEDALTIGISADRANEAAERLGLELGGEVLISSQDFIEVESTDFLARSIFKRINRQKRRRSPR